MKVTVENEKIKVNSPYNKSFVAGAKQIQGNLRRLFFSIFEKNIKI